VINTTPYGQQTTIPIRVAGERAAEDLEPAKSVTFAQSVIAASSSCPNGQGRYHGTESAISDQTICAKNDQLDSFFVS